MFSFICAWINSWVNNHEAGDLRRHRAHYDVIVMCCGSYRTHDQLHPTETMGVSIIHACIWGKSCCIFIIYYMLVRIWFVFHFDCIPLPCIKLFHDCFTFTFIQNSDEHKTQFFMLTKLLYSSEPTNENEPELGQGKFKYNLHDICKCGILIFLTLIWRHDHSNIQCGNSPTALKSTVLKLGSFLVIH